MDSVKYPTPEDVDNWCKKYTSGLTSPEENEKFFNGLRDLNKEAERIAGVSCIPQPTCNHEYHTYATMIDCNTTLVTKVYCIYCLEVKDI